MEQNIKDFVSKNYNALFELIAELCKIPAPSLHEERRAEFCKNWLEEVGAKGVYIDSAKNVVYPINCEGKKNILAIVAHTDTGFPDTEPMPYTDDGEKIHSPGVGDDTASLAVLMFLAKYIIENNLTSENGILLVCNSAEEGLGNLKGTRQLFKDYEGRIAKFVSYDSMTLKQMADRCVGSCRYIVTATTPGGHSYLKFGAPNAIHALAKIITKIYDIPLPKDSKTTVNVGTISGGTSVNTIAQSAQMLCEYRSDSADAIDMMKKEFAAIFESVQTDEIKIDVEVVGERPCAKGVDEAELLKLRRELTEIVEGVTGEPVIYESSSTDCNIPLSKGIPAITIGVYDGFGAHTREEWILKKSLVHGMEIAIKTALKLGF